MQPTHIFGPVVTPFLPGSEDLDLSSFTSNIEAHLAAGLSGVLVCGSTGEAALLTDDERRKLLDAARRVVPSGRTLLMGTGAESTRQTIARCADAKAGGADGVLVVAPHYYSSAMTTEALRTHYRAVADASPVPVLLYNIPKYMHFALPADLVAELATHPNVIGIKDSSGNLDMLKGFLAAQSDTFTVLTGNAGTFVPALEAGARGGIVAAALFAPALFLRMYDDTLAGRRGPAAAAQELAKPLGAVIVGELGVPGVKAAYDAVGLRGGVPRRPLLKLDAAGEQRVRELIAGAMAPA